MVSESIFAIAIAIHFIGKITIAVVQQIACVNGP